MSLRFHPNISILYPDLSFHEGVLRAAAAGFHACEFWWPLGESVDAVAASIGQADIEVELFNFYAGDLAGGDRGFLGDPERQHLFRENVPVALDLAARVGARKLNALLGHRLVSLSLEEQLDLARENVTWAADRASSIGATILIEAVNTFENGPYLLPTTSAVAAFIRRVGRSNVRIQYDVYHMQRMEGNIASTLETYMPEIGHIQIADAPDRGQPGTGEINFRFVFGEIARLGYRGSIGLEYRPRDATLEESMRWLPPHARRDGITPDEIVL